MVMQGMIDLALKIRVRNARMVFHMRKNTLNRKLPRHWEKRGTKECLGKK
jgi:hypothetical protein